MCLRFDIRHRLFVVESTLRQKRVIEHTVVEHSVAVPSVSTAKSPPNHHYHNHTPCRHSSVIAVATSNGDSNSPNIGLQLRLPSITQITRLYPPIDARRTATSICYITAAASVSHGYTSLVICILFAARTQNLKRKKILFLGALNSIHSALYFPPRSLTPERKLWFEKRSRRRGSCGLRSAHAVPSRGTVGSRAAT
ncbi:hypothetical protein RRG08_053444 [Elysia crispata]|uniref:Uncharacterized protein n=1 Tax=Elysia crispata TaxID=231223 RepID=A0AAE1DFD6_9GAST|nr:hypothetical protein RRG08_053444 [Elysia crispata]